jgi:5-methylcytosine-specific restriction endonuclease McrA
VPRHYTEAQKARRALQERLRWQARRDEGIKLLGGKCVHCGSTEDLEFDHIDPLSKSFAISEGMPSYSRWRKELKKCQLLCKGAHKIKSDLEELGTRAHGTAAMYGRGKCRCDECREWYNNYRRQWRKTKTLSN